MSKDVPKILYKKMRFMPIKIIFQVLLDMQHLMLCSEPLILRNKTERSILSKIRLSAHNLAIERGRHLD
jgi:hypothetical protein